jgi:MoaA/NifB/PqqE/SkfB family radical SAM enzyme
LTWDISGVCNAACKYCPSGSKNILGKLHKNQSSFLSPHEFEKALVFMTQNKIISPESTSIELYNWGEPFLHPQFETMLRIVSDLGFAFALSTNASVLKMIPAEVLWRLKSIAFSMSGFSQQSYDKIHGFNFDAICNNIVSIVAPIQLASPNTVLAVVFQLYRFNLSEVAAATTFCNRINIGFIPTCAHLTGIEMPKNEAKYKEELSISDELLTEQWDSIRRNQSGLWSCQQYSNLVLDERCNVLQCCVTERFTPGNVIGSVYEIDFSNLDRQRKTASVCVSCNKLQIGYLAHNANYDVSSLLNASVDGKG